MVGVGILRPPVTFPIRVPLIILLGSALSILGAVTQSPGKFVLTGSMTTRRTGHTATLLRDGRVLIAGGEIADARGKESFLASAELYDPSTGTFTFTGDMTTSREWHTATLLPDGRVFIAGGIPEAMGFPSSSEVYDPATGLFTRSGNMTGSHLFPTASLLSSGKVLITGYPTTELYDPATGAFTLLGPSNSYLGTTLLRDGTVLISGYGDVSLYDVTQDSIKLRTSWPGVNFYYQTPVVLADGRVLITGGDTDYGELTNDETLVYDTRSGTLKSGGLLLFSREFHTATVLPGGHVLLAGGYSSGGYSSGIPAVAEAEDYDPSSGSFTYAGADAWLRNGHTATLLPDGTVLIAGGTSATAAAELYMPPLRAASVASLTGPLAPGSLAVLFGSRLARVAESADALARPTSLGGISLRIVDSSGTASLAPLLYVSPSQIDFEVPAGTATGNVTIEVVDAPAQLTSTAARVETLAPALFADGDDTAIGYGLRIEPNGKQTVLSIENPIVLDERPVYLVLYATGIRGRSSVANVQCTIGGTTLSAEYAGQEGSGIPGLDQVNIRLTPALRGLGVANLVLTVDGIPSNPVSVDIR